MSNHTKECIPRGCFEVNLTALPTDKFQLTEEHDQAQKNRFEVHSCHHLKEWIPRGCFELNLTALPIDKFQLTEDHNPIQRNLLEVHSLMWHSFSTKEFNVKIYKVDLLEYMLCSLHSLTFQRICKFLP